MLDEGSPVDIIYLDFQKAFDKISLECLKMIEGYETKSYEQRLIDLRITTLEDRFYRADMIQVLKIMNDIIGIYF